MIQTIRVQGRHFDIESDALQEALALVPDLRESRPWCMCRPGEPPEMYVARVHGRFVVKRMPGTADQHDPSCASYEPPPFLGGLATVEGRAILHDETSDLTTLKVAFPLSRLNAPHSMHPAGAAAETAKLAATRLSMRSTLEYLWERAQLNRWHPSMAGRRNYAVVYKYIGAAARQTVVKGEALARVLYMPEPFYGLAAAEIRARAHASLAKAGFQRSGSQRMMLVCGEVKSLADARAGWQVHLRHAPFTSFHAAPVLRDRAVRLFARELALWNADPALHLMLLGSFAQDAGGVLQLCELSLATFDEGWIPVGSVAQVELYAALARAKRCFLRPFAYDTAGCVVADAFVSDAAGAAAIYMGELDPATRELVLSQCAAAGVEAVVMAAHEASSPPL